MGEDEETETPRLICWPYEGLPPEPTCSAWAGCALACVQFVQTAPPLESAYPAATLTPCHPSPVIGRGPPPIEPRLKRLMEGLEGEAAVSILAAPRTVATTIP